jgi:hypothetical protein
VVKEHYEVLCHHFRYSPEVETIIPKNAFKVTVLRDPIFNFESGFGFFRDYPYKQWLGDNPEIGHFLKNPKQFYNTSTPWYFRAKNYMGKILKKMRQQHLLLTIKKSTKKIIKKFQKSILRKCHIL